MKKLKICVYAICKNEASFVKRWVDSMSEADEIYVLDTGSTDDSVQILKELNVHVKSEKIDPWRFDVARNKSLDMVPDDTDICVCTDLDEIFEAGWRKTLESLWKDGVTQLAYNYNWSFDKNGHPEVNFYIEKIHTRNDYRWSHPVHEVLTYTGDKTPKRISTDLITLHHYPDHKKSRSSYLPLLELSVKESPEDDRNMHYLGREYMFYQKYQEAIDTLIKHLNLPTATWKDERCASMRFIARCYRNLNRFDEAKMWLDKAMKEAPYLRDPFMERSLLAYQLNQWQDVIEYTSKALQIKHNKKTYINESFCWNEAPYDLLSIAYYQLQEYDLSKFYCLKALEINKDDKRLQNNLKEINKKANG